MNAKSISTIESLNVAILLKALKKIANELNNYKNNYIIYVVVRDNHILSNKNI
jgi:hypothetical protein